MLMQSTNKHTLSAVRMRRREPRGAAQAAEFGAAVVALIVCFVIPLVDFGIIPVRWALAFNIVNSYVGNLSRAETFSRAWQQLEEDPGMGTMLKRIGGVNPKRYNLTMLITKPADGSVQASVDQPKRIPSHYLPDGPGGPYQYELELSAELEVSPLIVCNIGPKKIPGLNAPFNFTISRTSHWENLGRNPTTNEFYINE
ncbi:MAG TPA: hypothetical protein V6D17_20745 [Candidatus Obscuribacterales bacterium]